MSSCLWQWICQDTINPDDFFKQADQFSKDTPVYIDSSLGDGVKGEAVAKAIYALGFKKIYLATGYKKDHFGEMPWITDVVGKAPPFLKG
ncbi:MAG: hypothetical protein HQM16_03085 [Deltaproteobacteria bacterium]|nr:hypothetical protein [Deltaproteobacteria bacterium]